MLDLMFFLMLGHFLGDFALQSDRVAQAKKQSAKTLTLHVILYTLTLSLFLCFGLLLRESEQFFTLTTVLVLMFIFVEHWIQDFIKGRWFATTKQGFYVDQALHVLVLFVLRLYVYQS